MRIMRRLKRPSRLLAALVALCYCWLSLAMPFQHTHRFTEEKEALLHIADSCVNTQASLPLDTHLTAAANAPHSVHCLACEWQATNVSPALPAFAMTFAPVSTPRVITTFPRYLRMLAFQPTSRGPPAA